MLYQCTFISCAQIYSSGGPALVIEHAYAPSTASTASRPYGITHLAILVTPTLDSIGTATSSYLGDPESTSYP